MAAEFINTCPSCGAEESLDSLLLRMIDDDVVRRLIADVITASFPLGSLVVRYLRLHKPAKQRLRMERVATLLSELVPDVQRSAIERNGRTWLVTVDDWKGAFAAVFQAVEKGTLDVPIKNGNGYLYSVLMRKSDRTEAQAEQARENDRRQTPQRDTVQVKGQSMAIGDALQAVYGERDPALVEIEARARQAKPMDEATRARIDAIRKGKPA